MIRPGLAVFRRGPRHLQFGTTHDDCFVVEDRPGLVGLLRLLDGVRDTTTIACLAREHVGALTDDPDAIISALHDAGIIVDAQSCVDVAPGLAAEARGLLAQRIGTAELEARLLARTQSCVEVRADPSAAHLADGSADALRQTGIQTTRVADTLATLTLVVGAGPSHRSTFVRLRREHMPHLAVMASGGRVVIGPFVYPGLTPCVECLDRRRQEWDPSWEAVATQLDMPLVDAYDADDQGVSVATRLAAVSVITHEIATFCDEGIPQTTSRTIILGADVHTRNNESTAFHPDCPCRSLRRPIRQLGDPTQ